MCKGEWEGDFVVVEDERMERELEGAVDVVKRERKDRGV